MNKEQLEKMFDKQNFYETWYRSWEEYVNFEEIKQFIFNEIIPEVLNSMLEINSERSNDFTKSKISWNNIFKDIKQKAKELYWIYL